MTGASRARPVDRPCIPYVGRTKERERERRERRNEIFLFHLLQREKRE